MNIYEIKRLTAETSPYLTPEQYQSDKIQEVLESINNGEMKKELNENKVVEKVTVTYWTDAKQKLKENDKS